MASSRVPGFRPSVHGFHFANCFPPLRVPVAVPWGELRLGDASGGLCGGMVFAVRDAFEAGAPIPPVTITPQSEDDPLYRYLARRLVKSLNLPHGVLKYYTWMTWPDDDALWFRGVRTATVRNEWPKIQAMLDRGTLAPLGLITVQSSNPQYLPQNHQVLAYRYDLDEASGALRVYMYDPNLPDDDDLFLSLNVRTPSGVTASTGQTVRGFFLTSYRAPREADDFKVVFGA